MFQELFVPQSQTFLKLVVAPDWRANLWGKDAAYKQYVRKSENIFLADHKRQYKNSGDKIFINA